MNSGPMLSIGSTGPDVRRLQVLFVMMKEMNFSDVDGKFGPKTLELVKSFQEGSNLTADGVVGPLTWTKLPADPNTPRLALGATGSAVSGLQKGLKKFDVPNSPTDPGPIDGSFGPENRICRACLSNPARLDGGRRCWRSDVVDSGWRRRSNTCFSIRLGNCLVADELAQSWSRPPCSWLHRAMPADECPSSPCRAAMGLRN